MSEDDLLKQFLGGLSNVTAIALATGYPTIAAVPHVFVNAYKNVVAVVLGLDGEYSFPQADKIKEILAVSGGQICNVFAVVRELS